MIVWADLDRLSAPLEHSVSAVPTTWAGWPLEQPLIFEKSF